MSTEELLRRMSYISMVIATLNDSKVLFFFEKEME
jgi:hypothetical protein